MTDADLPEEVRSKHPDVPKADLAKMIEEMGDFSNFVGTPAPSLETFEERYCTGMHDKVETGKETRERAVKAHREAVKRDEEEQRSQESVEHTISPYIVHKRKKGEQPIIFYHQVSTTIR